MKKLTLAAMAALLFTASHAQTSPAAGVPPKDTAAPKILYLAGDAGAFQLLYKAVKASTAPYQEVELVVRWIEQQLALQVKPADPATNEAPKK